VRVPSAQTFYGNVDHVSGRVKVRLARVEREHLLSGCATPRDLCENRIEPFCPEALQAGGESHQSSSSAL